jgi:hypothetical protein
MHCLPALVVNIFLLVVLCIECSCVSATVSISGPTSIEVRTATRFMLVNETGVQLNSTDPDTDIVGIQMVSAAGQIGMIGFTYITSPQVTFDNGVDCLELGCSNIQFHSSLANANLLFGLGGLFFETTSSNPHTPIIISVFKPFVPGTTTYSGVSSANLTIAVGNALMTPAPTFDSLSNVVSSVQNWVENNLNKLKPGDPPLSVTGVDYIATLEVTTADDIGASLSQMQFNGALATVNVSFPTGMFSGVPGNVSVLGINFDYNPLELTAPVSASIIVKRVLSLEFKNSTGGDIVVKNLNVPLELTFPVTVANVPAAGGSISCGYWDHVAWSTYGCHVKSPNGFVAPVDANHPGKVTCQCNHASEFAVWWNPTSSGGRLGGGWLSVVVVVMVGAALNAC